MKYQMVISGFGGQGTVFLVKVLSECAGSKNLKFLGTENHGMSQRGGSVSSYIKIGNFYNPSIDKAQADTLLGLEETEGLRCVEFLKEGGLFVVNTDKDSLPHIDSSTSVLADAFKIVNSGQIPAQALNVYMLGVAVKHDKNFPFSVDDVKAAITKVNPKIAEKNIAVLDLALS